MPKKALPERTYYRPIKRYLEKEMGCVVGSYNRAGDPLDFICRGLGRLIIDVYGLRGFKDTHSRMIEGVAVEVKRSKSRTSLRHLVQASQYSRLAHRCYLAQPRDFDPKTRTEASRLGVGLLRIHGRRVTCEAESRPFTPDPQLFSLFLHSSLRVERCSLCDCYRFRYRSRAEAGPSPRGIDGHWTEDHIAPRRGKYNKKMFLCENCEGLISEIVRRAATQKTLAKPTRTAQRRGARSGC
jgi:hypothetical protein